MVSSRIRTRKLKPTDFAIVEGLFGPNGGCGGCWCMYWRVPSTGAYWEQHKGAKNKRSFKRLVESGQALGCLAFADDRAIGWCSVGPKEDFAYLDRSRSIPRDQTSAAWAISCIYILKEWRRRGVSRRLIEEACELAAASGARYLDAYPVLPKKEGLIPDAFAHTGLPGPYYQNGFIRIANAGSRDILRKSSVEEKVCRLRRGQS